MNQTIMKVFYVLILLVSINSVVLAQQKSVTGTVTDSSSEPLPGVTVVVKGTTKGTVTDINGAFTLSVPEKGEALVFSYIGMMSQEVSIETNTTFNVVLQDDVQGLEEVVVIGYGTQKKVNLTGAVETVNIEKELGERPTANVTTMLQGVLPGLTVSANNSGGEPGATQSIQIRGAGTVTGDGGTPYILIDGFPSTAAQMNSLNPGDIENVTILKDAASSAIYGSKGAFGVILLTTKGGKIGAGTKVKYSANVNFSSPTSLPKMANGLEFATAFNQSLLNNGRTPYWDEEELARLQQQVNGELDYETELNEAGTRWVAGRDGFANNDWWDLFYKDNSFGTEHNLSVTGGEKKTTYYISGNFFTRDGTFKYGDEKYDRMTFQSKINHKATDWLSFEANTRYSREKKDFPSGGFGNYNSSIIFHQISRAWSTNPAFDPDGNIIDANMLRLSNSGYTENHITTSTIQLATVIEPIKNWRTRISYNWKDRGTRSHREELQNYLFRPDGTSTNVGYNPNSVEKNYGFSRDQLFNITTSYNKSFGDHNLSGMAGYEQRWLDGQSIYAAKSDMLTQDIPSISTSVGEDYVNDALSSSATQGIFGRISYNYKEKFLAEVNARYDGSSYFSDGSRWGFFPSGSVGYNISNEDFWETIEPVVNRLKLKASYGQLGNHDWRLASLYEERMSNSVSQWLLSGTQANVIGAPTVVSPSLTWETVATTNFGLEAGLFDNKLQITFDAFQRVTSDMIGPVAALPAVLGSSAPKENNAEWTTRGWESKISWRSKVGDFSYRATVTISDAQTEITGFTNPTGILSTWREGQKAGEIWGYTTVGYFESDEAAAAAPSQKLFHNRWLAGDVQYADLDNSGAIDYGSNTEDDHGDLSIIGNRSPRYNYGINLGANWKGFDLSVLLQGVGKRDYVFNNNTNLFYGFRGNQWQTSVTKSSMDYWTPDNTDAYFPKPYFTGEHKKNTRTQTKYMQDASYMRLKNVQLSYTIPKRILKKLDVQVYYSGENLVLFTSLNENFDPETLGGAWGGGKLYPLNKVHSFGLNIGF